MRDEDGHFIMIRQLVTKCITILSTVYPTANRTSEYVKDKPVDLQRGID